MRGTMKTLYEKVNRRLEQIDFEALWPGFHPFPFALYDGTHAVLDGCLTDCPETFRGNTAVIFQGQPTAIWNIGSNLPGDDIRLASELVHEMFHAFQMERNEKRFPNDLILASAELSSEYLALKAEEYRCLTEPDGLPRFRALREMRRAVNGGYIQEEFLTETIDGMAQYVELCALEQLSALKRQPSDHAPSAGKNLQNRPPKSNPAINSGQAAGEDPSRPKSQSGGQQQAALAECTKRLTNPRLLLDSRRCAYDSGALLMFSARRQGISVFHNIGDESRSLYDVLLTQLPKADCLPTINLSKEALAPWSRILSEQAAQREALIRAFLYETHTTVEGSFRICGYDPMNLWRKGDTLYSTSFLCLVDEKGNTLTLTGKALLQMRHGFPDIAEAYSTLPSDT